MSKTGWFVPQITIGARPAKAHFYQDGKAICGRAKWKKDMRVVGDPRYSWPCSVCARERNEPWAEEAS